MQYVNRHQLKTGVQLNHKIKQEQQASQTLLLLILNNWIGGWRNVHEYGYIGKADGIEYATIKEAIEANPNN